MIEEENRLFDMTLNLDANRQNSKIDKTSLNSWLKPCKILSEH